MQKKNKPLLFKPILISDVDLSNVTNNLLNNRHSNIESVGVIRSQSFVLPDEAPN